MSSDARPIHHRHLVSFFPACPVRSAGRSPRRGNAGPQPSRSRRRGGGAFRNSVRSARQLIELGLAVADMPRPTVRAPTRPHPSQHVETAARPPVTAHPLSRRPCKFAPGS